MLSLRLQLSVHTSKSYADIPVYQATNHEHKTDQQPVFANQALKSREPGPWTTLQENLDGVWASLEEMLN